MQFKQVDNPRGNSKEIAGQTWILLQLHWVHLNVSKNS